VWQKYRRLVIVLQIVVYEKNKIIDAFAYFRYQGRFGIE
jgi:hypothetical protein